MAYTKTNWVNNTTPLNATNMNKIEEGIAANDAALNTKASVDYVNKTHYGYSGNDLLIIPEGTTTIGENAYKDTTYKCVVIPDSVTSIGNSAFYNCSGLTSIMIPNSVTSIGGLAFYNCSDLTSITIPNNVTSISDGTFNSCTSLTSITIPNNVTSIGRGAFSGCRSLTSIMIPNSVTSIDQGALYSCPLNIIDLTAYTTQSFPTLGQYNFNAIASNCKIKVTKGRKNDLIATSGWSDYANYVVEVETVDTALITAKNYADTTLITAKDYTNKTHYGYSGNDLLIIPEGTTTIGDNAYRGKYYKCVVIPNSVTSIGKYAFDHCRFLTNITIPDSVTSIGYGAFGDCWDATSITIGNGVTSIGDYAFSSCSYPTSITIPDSVTSIGNSAFSYCTGLKSITIPNSVTSIGNSAFSYCTGLKSITIGNGVTSIGNSAFISCPLTTIDLTAYTTQSFPTLGTSNFGAIASNCQIKVVKGRKNDLIATSGWSNYASYIVEVPTVETLDTTIEAVKNGYLPLSGGTVSGAMTISGGITTQKITTDTLSVTDASGKISVTGTSLQFAATNGSVKGTITGIADYANDSANSSTVAVSQKCLVNDYIPRTGATGLGLLKSVNGFSVEDEGDGINITRNSITHLSYGDTYFEYNNGTLIVRNSIQASSLTLGASNDSTVNTLILTNNSGRESYLRSGYIELWQGDTYPVFVASSDGISINGGVFITGISDTKGTSSTIAVSQKCLSDNYVQKDPGNNSQYIHGTLYNDNFVMESPYNGSTVVDISPTSAAIFDQGVSTTQIELTGNNTTITGISNSKGTSSTIAASQKCLADNYLAKSDVTYSDTDLTAGTSPLATGSFYFVYE